MENTRIGKTRDVVNYSLKYISGKTLDLGCGTAKYKNAILKAAGSYISMDVVPGFNVDVVGDINKTPFPDEEFSTVISTQVLEHVPRPWLAAKEIFRILKPGGYAVITAPFMIGYHPDPNDNFRFTKDGLALIFEDAGFEITEKRFYGNLLGTVSEIIRFSFLNPYEKHSNFSIRLMCYLEKALLKMDNIIKPKSVFGNAFVIAHKPLK
jgi:SAM-dependent methyltransferase